MNSKIESAASSRVYGLDLMRAIAVLFVLIGHSLEHSTVPKSVIAFGRLGIIGVEIFFVLSGFLIGSIVLKLIEENRFSGVSDILTFWKRRWLRTLPLYFVILIVFLKIDYNSGPHKLLEFPSYFIFMQNFAWKIANFFELSWSLAIEEHFYLLFPLFYLLIKRLARYPERSVWMTALVFIFAAYAYRLSLGFFSDWEEFNRSIRMVVLARIDAIMFGVLVAAIRMYRARLYDLLRRLTPFFAISCVVISSWWFIGVPGILQSKYIQLNLFSVESMLFALMIPWFDSIRYNSVKDDFIEFTSKISYSLYLIHVPVIIFVNGIASRLGVFSQVYENPLVLYCLYFSFFYFSAWISHELIERPFIAMREDRITPLVLWRRGRWAFAVSAIFIFLF